MFFFLSILIAGCTENAPEPYANQGWVSDYANILSQPVKTRISQSLAAYERETCHQVYVLIVPSTRGEKLIDLSQRTANSWTMGQSGFGNGILLSIAMQEGTMRMETASAFDWFVEKGVTKRILEEVMVPYFKDQRFAEGIEMGLGEIMKAARLKVIPADHRPDVCRN